MALTNLNNRFPIRFYLDLDDTEEDLIDKNEIKKFTGGDSFYTKELPKMTQINEMINDENGQLVLFNNNII